MLRRSHMPLLHLGLPKAAGERWHATLASLRERLGTGLLAILVGPRGTGKTQLAVALGLETCCTEYWRPEPPVSDLMRERDAAAGVVYRSDTPVRYSTAAEVFDSLKDSFEHGAVTRRKRDLSSPRLLILDEVQERGDTAWEDRELTSIIDRRYRSMLDTVLICNVLPSELTASLGESIISRARECGCVVVCDWPSFRKPHESGKSVRTPFHKGG